MRFKTWLMEIRTPYLILPLVLSAIGTVLAYDHGHFDAVNFILFTTVLLLLHISVNTLNDYYDERSGIDRMVNRTQFNGGSGVIQAGLLRSKEVFNAAIACFVIAMIISAYLVVTVSFVLLWIVVPGMIFALFYTQIFARNMLGEISAGLGLGCLPVIGAYLVQVQEFPLALMLISIPSSLLTFNLLLVNEFPDVKADIVGGRRNLVISMGERKAAWLYMITTAVVYITVLVGVALSLFPLLAAIALLTLPLAFKAIVGAFKGTDDAQGFMNAQKTNVLVVNVTQILFVAGCMIALVL